MVIQDDLSMLVKDYPCFVTSMFHFENHASTNSQLAMVKNTYSLLRDFDVSLKSQIIYVKVKSRSSQQAWSTRGYAGYYYMVSDINKRHIMT